VVAVVVVLVPVAMAEIYIDIYMDLLRWFPERSRFAEVASDGPEYPTNVTPQEAV